MQHTIFYSWQGDLPNNTNRGFLRAALEEAASALAADLAVEPRIDQDTQNVPGSPDIARTILKKIEISHVFVADVTLINPAAAERRTPNPNVLLELGYAMHALGEDRVILLMNTAFGPIEQLPFDLKMRRVIPYNATSDGEKGPERRRLAASLKTAIKAAVESIPQAPLLPDATETATNAIETAAPNRILAIRRAMGQIVSELESVAPPLFRNGGTVDQLIIGLNGTVSAVGSYTRLAEAIASMDDTYAARTLYKGLIPILEHYDNPRGFTGTYNERDFDYWKFLGHELLTTLTAMLLREERYETINAIIEEPITVGSSRRAKPVTFGYASEWLQSLEPIQKAKGRVSYHADLLRERHARKDNDTPENGPLADILPFDELLAADYLLFLRGELETHAPRDRGFEWIPWTSVYLRETPDFLHAASRTATAQRLAIALGVPDVVSLKSRLLERAARLSRLWQNGFYDQPLTKEDIERIGSR